ncbi:MAG: DUF1266 domain-containing protein [Bacteroidales bacterium]|jgi:hypothetical protein|nr:DUF1266 domain-containing protein [Bacteroidales bacterium]
MSKLIFELEGTPVKKNVFKKYRSYVAVFDDSIHIELNGDKDTIPLKDIFNAYIKEPFSENVPCRTTMIEFAEEGEDNWYELEDDVFEGLSAKFEKLFKNEWSVVRKKKDELPLRVRWFNATCVVLRVSAEQDPELFGGYYPNSDSYEDTKEILYESWGLNNEHDFKEMLASLYNGRAAKEYESDKEKFDNELFTHIQQTCGDKGIWAWDLCRLILLCGYGYLCNYISYEEALEWCSKAGKKMQSIYTSWDDMMTSYLLGYCYWSGERIDDPTTEVYARANIYQFLRKQYDGPFSIDWHTEL